VTSNVCGFINVATKDANSSYDRSRQPGYFWAVISKRQPPAYRSPDNPDTTNYRSDTVITRNMPFSNATVQSRSMNCKFEPLFTYATTKRYRVQAQFPLHKPITNSLRYEQIEPDQVRSGIVCNNKAEN